MREGDRQMIERQRHNERDIMRETQSDKDTESERQSKGGTE